MILGLGNSLFYFLSFVNLNRLSPIAKKVNPEVSGGRTGCKSKKQQGPAYCTTVLNMYDSKLTSLATIVLVLSSSTQHPADRSHQEEATLIIIIVMKRKDRWDSSSEEEDNDKDNESDTSHVKDNESDTSHVKHKTKPLASTDPKSNHNTTIQASSNHPIIQRKNNNHILSTESSSNNRIDHLRSSSESLAPQYKYHNPLLQGCRSVYDSYERLDRIDEGTYGIVWKAIDNTTHETVALKQIKFDPTITQEGFPMAALREISVLLSLSHECIVTVKEMVVGSGYDKVFMVMEYMQMDLQDAMRGMASGGVNTPFPQAELKNMLYQILSAMSHVHEKWYIHRDMKTSNILVHKSGKIALCDFGLARKYQLPLKAMTQTVITLWYRPVELLFGSSVYGPEVDMWSIGCIFGELLKKEAILQGQGELDQIDQIFKLLGLPNEKNWPGFKSLPNANLLRWKQKGKPLVYAKFPVNSLIGGQTFLDGNGFDLLMGLLEFNPKKRLTAKEALEHTYFSEGVARRTPQFRF